MTDITAQELMERMTNGETLNILDVREQYEYDEYNLGAILIPLGDLQSRIDEFDDWMDMEVIVHCRSGARSAAAKAFMLQNGFKNVRSLLGGVMAFQALKE